VVDDAGSATGNGFTSGEFFCLAMTDSLQMIFSLHKYSDSSCGIINFELHARK
jgi:hypothetical protein